MPHPLRRPGPARLPGRRSARRWWTLPVVAALAVLASACQPAVQGGEQREPVTLIVSQTWVQQHQGGGGSGAAAGDATARLRSLQQAVDRLRKQTRTGWVGRQDDVTGYLSELSGGAWPGTTADFMDDYGPALFGVDSSVLRFGDVDTQTVPGVSTTKATQAVGDVPVLDSSLVFSGRGSSAATDDLRVTGVHGRVYPGLTVGTTPVVTAEQAATAAAEAAGEGSTTDGTARLVVLPTGAGVLAWEVVVLGTDAQGAATAGRYYLDAATGLLVDVRPVSADVAAPLPHAAGVSEAVRALRRGRSAQAPRAARTAPDPGSVEVTGTDPLGRALTAYGVRTGGGVELTDTTTEAWDAETGRGAVQTYDASTVRNESQLPGRLVTSASTTITDADAIAAQAYSHDIVEYWESLGRDSWDDAGGPLFSSVHFGPETYCNAFFAGYLRQPQMVYGNPCFQQGRQLSGTFVEPDIAAHEVTHGVTQTTAGLLYTGQSGALNESFSDYFGNVIGNLIHATEGSTLGEDSCSQVEGPTPVCVQNPDGTTSFRNMLNGNDFDQYLRILNPGIRLSLLAGYRQDQGGVHYNSAIWNNALWTIRTRLAQIDNQPANTSSLAHDFDRAVYGALATRLTPASGFVDARAAVEQVITDSQLDPVVLRVAREVFDQEKICTGCPAVSELAGDAVSTSPQTQLHPSISGDQVLWLDLSSTSDYAGYAAATTLGTGGAPRLSAGSDALEVAFAGDAVVALDVRGQVTRTDASGATTVLDRVPVDATLAAGFSGSDDGGAWLAPDDTVTFVDAAGTLTRAQVTGLRGDTITTVSTGGGTVAIGTDQGKVFAWTPGSGEPRQVGQVSGAVLSAAAYAGNVFVIDDAQDSALFTADGQQLDVTGSAAPFGAAMSSEYVVWSEAVGGMQSGVVPGGRSPYPDTDLYLLSLASGKIYDLHPAPAQQGFPSISGRQLVWQDATFGGDDVFTAAVPEGL